MPRVTSLRWLSCVAFLALPVSGLAATPGGESALKVESTVLASSPEAAATIVVYNTNDPDSADLARFYLAKRGIPKDQMIGLDCPNKEEITRAEYDDTIAEPLRKAFARNAWWQLRPIDHPLGRVEKSRICFVALIRGMPLKIAPTGAYPGDRMNGPAVISTHNEASVDSELAMLGAYSRVISGVRENPCFRSFTRMVEGGSPEQLLVARLDAPTPALVKKMITDSLEAEREGLRGFAYIDARNIQDPGFKIGDKWLYNAATMARRRGFPVIFDNGEGLFPDAYPMRDVAIYLGWYTENVTGVFRQPGFRFVPGAVAVHIHSFSASTLRGEASHWCGPLIAAGAAATLGNVYEPYLGLTPQLDIFHDRLQNGFTLAESAWMSVQATSWQTTVIGDPLYRPFRFLNDFSRPPGGSAWDFYRDGARLWLTKDRASGEAALTGSAKRLRSGVIWEGLGLLELTTPDGKEKALTAFREARQVYHQAEDAVRAAIHEVILLRGLKRDVDAAAVIQEVSAAFPKARAVEVLKVL